MTKSRRRAGRRREKPSKPRTGGRSARVVHDVLGATLEAFAEHGYAGVGIDDVARRAGVNKTTVYRRWPTKADLLGAALFSLRDDDPPPPNSGSLRDDLFVLLRDRSRRMATPRARAIMHALLLSNADPDLQAIVQRLRRERPAISPLVIERAIQRGELPADTDARLLVEALLGPLHSRVYWKRDAVTESYLRALVNLVVSGAAAGGARRQDG